MLYKHIELVVTNKCNNNCYYCLRHQHDDVMSLELMKEKLKQYYHKDLLVTFFGGEPLLEIKNIVSLVGWARQNGMFPLFEFPTNGKLLTKSLVQFLRDNDINISLSYDGPRGQVYRTGSSDIHLLKDFGFKHYHRVLTDINSWSLIDDTIDSIALGVTKITVNIAKKFKWKNLDKFNLDLQAFADWYVKEGIKKIDIDLFSNPIIAAHRPVFDCACDARISRIGIAPDGEEFPCSELVQFEIIPNSSRVQCNICEYRAYCEGLCQSVENWEDCDAKKILFKTAIDVDRRLCNNIIWNKIKRRGIINNEYRT